MSLCMAPPEGDLVQCPTFEALVCRYPGVKGINDECNRIYPDQLNPLQIQSLVKSWRGGPDPLDYISMFSFDSDNSEDVPSHWHYVSYGLSDLHCDGRLFSPQMFGADKSGFGIELSFRLKKEPGELDPPLWPAKLMQSLARYVYSYGHAILPGDHISWHQGMNADDPASNKELCQILLTSDPQLQPIRTPAGMVEFVQIVPVTTEELLSVQKWSVNAFLELMKDLLACGGRFLVTDMSRTQSLFELKPELEKELIQGILHDGSDLSGVNALVCSWTPDAWKYYDKSNCHHLKKRYQRLYFRASRHEGANSASRLIEEDEDEEASLSGSPEDSDEGQRSDDAGRRLDKETDYDLAASFSAKCQLTSMENASVRQLKAEDTKSNMPSPFPSSAFASSVIYFDLMHITINLEAGFCFPLALTGRLRHGRHFTFKGITSGSAITLVSSSVHGAFVTDKRPFGAFGGWLQILMADGLIEAITNDFETLLSTPNVAYPQTFVWPQWNFGLTLVI